MSQEFTRLANDILADLPSDAQFDEDEIALRIQTFIDEYHVPKTVAKETVKKECLNDHNSGADPESAVDGKRLTEIDSGETGINITVTVLEAWETETTVQTAQLGVVTDGSGKCMITVSDSVCDKSAVLPLENGQTYAVSNADATEIEGTKHILLGEQAQVSEQPGALQRECDVATDAVLVGIHDGSGLITRCGEADCRYTLNGSECPVHGFVDGTKDLRVKASFDDGSESYNVVLDAEQTERVTGVSLADAIEIAREEGDIAAVTRRLEEALVCNTFHIEGNSAGQYIVLEVIREADIDLDAEAEATLAQARRSA